MCNTDNRLLHITGSIRASSLLVIFAQITCWAQPNDANIESVPVVLREGQSESATNVSSSPAAYVFEAAQGQSYLIEIDQKSVDVVVAVEDPGGVTRTFDTPLRDDGSEYALVEKASAGIYRVSVGIPELANASGGYTISLSLLGENSVVGARTIEAWRLMSDAAAANANPGRPDHDEALKTYVAAAGLWRELGRSPQRAQALYSAAMLNYWVAGEWHVADRMAGEAAQLYAAISKPTLQANAILLQAMALTEAINETDDKEPILDTISAHLEQSYRIHEKLGNTRQLARVRYFNALSNLNAGHQHQAKTFYAEAAEHFAAINDWTGARNILLDRAVIDIDAGNNNDAIRQLEELRRLDYEKNPLSTSADGNFIATVLDQLGAAYGRGGEIDKALAAFSEARRLHKEARDDHGEAESLRGIAGVYLDSGDSTLAQEFLLQAEKAAIESKNGRVLSVVHATLGNIAYAEGDYQRAEGAFAQALKWAPDAGPVRAHRQVLLAKAYLASGDFKTAIDLADGARRAAMLAEGPRAEADALHLIGEAYLGLQEPRQSIDNLEQALIRYQRLGLADGQADVENALAVSLAGIALGSKDHASRLEMLDDALLHSEQSLRHLEGLLGKVSAPEMRAYYTAIRREYYKTHIDLLIERYNQSDKPGDQYVSDALATSERARARMTMDLLNEASVELQQDVNPQIAAEMTSLLDQLGALQNQKELILGRGGVDDRVGKEITELSHRMAAIKNQIDLLQVDLRRTNKHYSALTAPETVSLSEIQDLIDDQSVMLQYSLGNSRSFVWIVTSDSIQVVQLADRAAIDAAAGRAFASLTSLGLDAAAREKQTEALRTISRLILQPVAALIGNKRLIVVADGTLNYLPFQTLPLETEGSVEPLMETREVVALPSMSVLAVLRERGKVNRPAKSVAVFADPVFDESDSRLNGSARHEANETAINSSILDRIFATRSSLSGYLPRLEGARTEAMAIADMAGDDDSLVVLGFDANRNEVLTRDLSEYRYLHFATHGKVDRQTPALSALVLSRFDERGEPQNGYLRLHDIYRLKLNADLVVLSACQTGLGTDIHGEGLIGLTQGFLYAGARSLLVSLWDVPDRPTSELMIRFYRQMLVHGMRPAAALRHAQQSMASDRRWRDPYFWSAFILLGDWQ